MRKIEEEYLVTIRCKLNEITPEYFGYLSTYKNIMIKRLKEWGVKILDQYMNDNGIYIIVTGHIPDLLKEYYSLCYKNDPYVVINFVKKPES